MAVSVLMVCLGNICRSPTAEAVLRGMAEAEGLDLRIDSAGTGDWHLGEAPHPPAVAAGLRRGHDLGALRARQVRPEDFRDFEVILAMDRQNLADLRALRARAGGQGTEPRLFLDLVPGQEGRDVPDPWYTGEFDRVIDLCEAGCARLLDELRAKG